MDKKYEEKNWYKKKYDNVLCICSTPNRIHNLIGFPISGRTNIKENNNIVDYQEIWECQTCEKQWTEELIPNFRVPIEETKKDIVNYATGLIEKWGEQGKNTIKYANLKIKRFNKKTNSYIFYK